MIKTDIGSIWRGFNDRFKKKEMHIFWSNTDIQNLKSNICLYESKNNKRIKLSGNT